MLSYDILWCYIIWFIVFIVFFNAFVVEEQVKKTSWELHFVVVTDNLKENPS